MKSHTQVLSRSSDLKGKSDIYLHKCYNLLYIGSSPERERGEKGKIPNLKECN